jgi:hypothetical protein
VSRLNLMAYRCGRSLSGDKSAGQSVGQIPETQGDTGDGAAFMCEPKFSGTLFGLSTEPATSSRPPLFKAMLRINLGVNRGGVS